MTQPAQSEACLVRWPIQPSECSYESVSSVEGLETIRKFVLFMIIKQNCEWKGEGQWTVQI